MAKAKTTTAAKTTTKRKARRARKGRRQAKGVKQTRGGYHVSAEELGTIVGRAMKEVMSS